jgi:hypothetical protein
MNKAKMQLNDPYGGFAAWGSFDCLKTHSYRGFFVLGRMLPEVEGMTPWIWSGAYRGKTAVPPVPQKTIEDS